MGAAAADGTVDDGDDVDDSAAFKAFPVPITTLPTPPSPSSCSPPFAEAVVVILIIIVLSLTLSPIDADEDAASCGNGIEGSGDDEDEDDDDDGKEGGKKEEEDDDDCGLVAIAAVGEAVGAETNDFHDRVGEKGPATGPLVELRFLLVVEAVAEDEDDAASPARFLFMARSRCSI